MPKTLFAALLLSLSPVLFAQTADVRIVSMTLSGEPTLTGERFAMAMRWRNDGPSTATIINVSVSGTPSPYYILSVATSGWPCYPNPEGTSFLCQHQQLAPGAEAEMVLQLLTPSTPGPFVLRGQISAAEADPNPANNSTQISMNLAAAPPADLSITPSTQLHTVPSDTPVAIPFVITNNGPNEVRNLFAAFSVPVTANIPAFTAGGPGWSCEHPPFGPQTIVCTRSSLRDDEVAPITIRSTSQQSSVTYTARVRAEGHSDLQLGNDTATARVVSNDFPPVEPVAWTPILVPLTGNDVPGVNGALWRTETTALIASDTQLFFHQQNAPLRRPFNLLTQGLLRGSPTGQYLWVRAEDAEKVRINSRVYDVARQTQTAGSEIPIARASDFTTTGLSIVGIPVAPHYRHTIRIYDQHGVSGALVRVRLYANDETLPRVHLIQSLAVNAAQPQDTLPMFPAYAQLDLGQIMQLNGVRTVRIDIDPEGVPQVPIWAFVSVTNNETHHVTTFSAQ
jgi:hypothetical protein